MPIKDNKSGSEHLLIAFQDVPAPFDVSFQTMGVDTFNYDNGLTIVAYVMSGNNVNFRLTAIKQNSVNNFSTATNVKSNQIIGELSDLDISVPTTLSTPVKTIGLIGTDRFLFFAGALNAIDADATALVYMVGGVELSPGDN